MTNDVELVFQALLGRLPNSDEASLDELRALRAVVKSPEFRAGPVLAAAGRNDLSLMMTASVGAHAARLAELAPLTSAGRKRASGVATRGELLNALFSDLRFVDEIHAKADLDWPAELFSRRQPSRCNQLTQPDFVISILMPVYNTPAFVLQQAIESVMMQTYPFWELCICDDCSTQIETSYVLERFRGCDPRIKIIRSPRNLHIAEATNLAAELATGDFIGLLDHDDMLTPDALTLMARAAVANPTADVLYSDEDKLEIDGSRSEPYLKPDWSPEMLMSMAYVLHFMMVRKSLFLSLGGFRDAYTGSQDYDLTLRATYEARSVLHVPEVLYHWRKIPGSAAAVVDAKPQALINAERALQDFVSGIDPEAKVSPGLFTGSYRVEWPVDPERRVTILIPTGSYRTTVEGRGDLLLVEHAADSIYARSSFRNFELVIVDDGRMPSDARARLEAQGARIERYEVEPPFSFARKINRCFDFVRTEDVIILNDDVEIITPDWIEALMAHSRRPGVGAVGARLLYPNRRTQHAGIVLGVLGPCTHIFHNQPADEPSYCGFSHVVRNMSAVTGAVMATRMSLVRWVGGFDTKFSIDYNDIDFCLRLGALGFKTIYTPFATLFHFENSSFSRREPTRADEAAFCDRWASEIKNDPYYNPRLARDRTDCAVSDW